MQKNSPGIGRGITKRKTSTSFIHRSTFIHKFICDFLMVYSTYKCKNSPRHWVWHHWQEFSSDTGNRMQKFMKMLGTYDIKEADALQVLRYDTWERTRHRAPCLSFSEFGREWRFYNTFESGIAKRKTSALLYIGPRIFINFHMRFSISKYKFLT